MIVESEAIYNKTDKEQINSSMYANVNDKVRESTDKKMKVDDCSELYNKGINGAPRTHLSHINMAAEKKTDDLILTRQQ